MFENYPTLLRAWRVTCCVVAAAFLIWRGYAFTVNDNSEMFVPTLCFGSAILMFLTGVAFYFRSDEIAEDEGPDPLLLAPQTLTHRAFPRRRAA
jgi:hypothetical protein